jgi:Calpain family cysteine protease/Bacterial Ig-like domain (group 2)
MPSGASVPVFSINATNAAKNTKATLGVAGTYRFTVSIADTAGLRTTSSVNVAVRQSLTSVTISPASIIISVGGTQQFIATAKDQFGRALVSHPKFTWKSSGGRITSRGLFTAPMTTGNVTVTATATAMGRSFKGATTVSVIPSFGDPQIRSLVQTLDADGSLDRGDLMQILLTVGNEDGVVDATEFNDLKTIVADASIFHIPGYVAALVGYVVDGNPANAHYEGQPLGNLGAGSSITILHDLVDKWFLGTDHPAVTGTGITYQTVAGSLFVNGPSYTDMFQGELGDCYLISSLGALAKSNPSVIDNMIIPNGDNTWTVRFYESDGVPDYVTVDRALPTEYGYLVYADMGSLATNSQNELWIPLVEKAYAQWNETGQEGREDGTNSYGSIESGNPGVVFDQVLGNQSADYLPTTDPTNLVEPELISAITANKPVTASTYDNPGNGLVGNHVYTVIGYDSASDTFLLYNPWGCDQPSPLTISQLQASVAFFFSADASVSVPFGSALAGPSEPRFAAILNQASAASRADVFASELAASNGLAPESMQFHLQPAKTPVVSVGIKVNADDWWLDALVASHATRALTARTPSLKRFSPFPMEAIDAAFA